MRPLEKVRTFLIPYVLLTLAACGGGGGGGPTQSAPPGDKIAPSGPFDVDVTASTPRTITVSWVAATDNVGVAGYRVYRDGAFFRAVASSPMSDAGLTPGVQYCYGVSAYDAAGNEGARSTAACAMATRELPVAALAAPSSAFPGTLLTFDASQSRAPEGTLISYVFDFADGSAPVSQATPVAQHGYSTLGTFTASVTVTDNFAGTATATAVLTIGLVLEEPVNVSRTPNLSQIASSFRGADGSISVAWEESDSIMFSRSGDGGRTFSPSRFVNDPAGPWGIQNGYSSAQANVVAAGIYTHVVWTVYDLSTRGAEVFHVRSSDGGATFTDSVIVSPVDTYNSYNSSVVADDDGAVFITWLDDDLNSGPRTGIHYARSMDYGASFFLRGMLPGTLHALCPSVTGSSVQIDMAWMQLLPEGSHTLFARSLDGAQTFSDPIVLDPLTDVSWCPRLARDPSGNIYAVWIEGTVFVDRKIRFAVSADGGATFGIPVTLSSSFEDVFCPAIAAGAGGRVYIAWATQNSANIDSFLTYSLDSGRTFSPALRIDAGALDGVACPGVLIGDDDQIGLTWHTPHSVNSPSEIFYATAQVSRP